MSTQSTSSTDSKDFRSTEDPNKKPFVLPWPYTPIAPPTAHRIASSDPKEREAEQKRPIPKIFQPLTIRGLTLKNRIGVSPMCQYSSINGYLTDWHFAHLAQFAIGGAGLIIQEATAVVPEGRITPQDVGIYLPEHVEMQKRVVNFIHSQHAAAGIQLAHAGRKASTYPPWVNPTNPQKPYAAAEEGGWPEYVVGPSSIPYANKWIVPREMTTQEVTDSIEHWITGTKRAVEAGFDYLEIHAAHGYLLSSFLSPLSNQRTDKYGGSFQNRIRYLLEITKAVRNVWPNDKPLSVRVSCDEWVEGGWTNEDTIKLVAELIPLGVDVIDCSSGGNNPAQKIPIQKGYQVPFSEAIKKQYNGKILTAAVGLIDSGKQAEEILGSGKADLIFIAREFLRNPQFVLNAAQELGFPVATPPQYQRANHWHGKRFTSLP